jgi:chromate reductase
MNVLALSGSLRQGSFNRLLLQAAQELAPSTMRLEIGASFAAIPLFDEDLETACAGGPEPVARLRRAIVAADGLLIATPEYNQSIPGVLKNAIDWLSRPAPQEVLAGKPVALIGASGGRWGTRLAQSALRQVLTATESIVMPAPALYAREAERLFDPQGKLVDEPTRTALKSVIEAFSNWIDVNASARR